MLDAKRSLPNSTDDLYNSFQSGSSIVRSSGGSSSDALIVSGSSSTNDIENVRIISFHVIFYLLYYNLIIIQLFRKNFVFMMKL
jgi:hypothetical protein